MAAHNKSSLSSPNLENLAECADCTCFNLRKASRSVTQLFDDALRPLGLRGTQFTMLVHIKVFGPVTISVLAEKIVTDRTTLARNLNPLEKNGLITVKSGKDKRTRYIEITKKGEDTLERSLPYWKQTQDKIKKMMGKGKWTATISNLRELVARSQSV